MVKFVCDRCRRVMEADEICGCHISYMNENGNNGVDLCKECFEEFLNWMKNKPAEDKPVKECEKNIIEGYEKAIHNYQQQIIDLTEIVDKTKASSDWWSHQCTEIFKDICALHKKVEEMVTHGNVR